MHLEKYELGLNTISSEYMRYNGPSLKKWVGWRLEQSKKPYGIGRSSTKLNGSSEGDEYAMNTTIGRNQIHKICGTTYEVVA